MIETTTEPESQATPPIQVSKVNVETKENLPVSPECETTSREDEVLKHHMHVHTGEKPIPSPQCDNEVGDGARSHLIKSIKDQPDKQPTHPGENPISNHIKHTGEKPCNTCNLIYTSEDHFAEHTQAHRGLVPYNCLDCAFKTVDLKKFTSHLITKIHMKNHVHGLWKTAMSSLA